MKKQAEIRRNTYEMANLGDYKLIYPSVSDKEMEEYDIFMRSA
jgi:hypothetical protein